MAPTRPAWLTATVAVWIATALLFALAFPVAVALDSVLDRVKPMYADRAEMLWLQSQNVQVTGQSVPVELSPGESVEVAGESFTASPGVTVEVRADQPSCRASACTTSTVTSRSGPASTPTTAGRPRSRQPRPDLG